MNECSINHNAEKKTIDLIIYIVQGKEESIIENAEVVQMHTVPSNQRGRTTDM